MNWTTILPTGPTPAPVLPQHSGTIGWTYDSVEFTVPSHVRSVDIQCELRGQGTVWFDDVWLQKLFLTPFARGPSDHRDAAVRRHHEVMSMFFMHRIHGPRSRDLRPDGTGENPDSSEYGAFSSREGARITDVRGFDELGYRTALERTGEPMTALADVMSNILSGRNGVPIAVESTFPRPVGGPSS